MKQFKYLLGTFFLLILSFTFWNTSLLFGQGLNQGGDAYFDLAPDGQYMTMHVYFQDDESLIHLVLNKAKKVIYVSKSLAPFKDVLQSYSYCEDTAKREMAVACALELIRANVVGAPSHKLGEHLIALSEYADLIQNSLNKS